MPPQILYTVHTAGNTTVYSRLNFLSLSSTLGKPKHNPHVENTPAFDSRTHTRTNPKAHSQAHKNIHRHIHIHKHRYDSDMLF